VRQLQKLQRPLQGTVFTVAAMQGNENTVETGIDQIHQRVAASIEQVRIDAGAAQGFVHPLSRHQRYLALGGAPAIQNTNPSEVVTHARSPICPGTRLMEPAPITTTTS